MAVSIVLFFLELLYLNLLYVPAHRGPSEDLPAIFVVADPLLIEVMVFIIGLLLEIGGIVKRLKAKDNGAVLVYSLKSRPVKNNESPAERN